MARVTGFPESAAEWRPSPLRDWCAAVDQRVEAGRLEEAVALLRVILVRLPRHLPSYERLLHLIWRMRRWDEGADWARRLLRADPCHELAWLVWARSVEEEGDLELARKLWRRALVYAPYSRTVRRGVLRTHVGVAHPLDLDHAALATLYRHGHHWSLAASLYERLAQVYPNRLDIRCGLLESLWRGDRLEEALDMARQLSRLRPDLYLSWLVMDRAGDADDRALAHAPLAAFDADREYAWARFEEPLPRPAHQIPVSPEELSLLEA